MSRDTRQVFQSQQHWVCTRGLAAPSLHVCSPPAFVGAANIFQSYEDGARKPQKLPGNSGQVQCIWERSRPVMKGLCLRLTAPLQPSWGGDTNANRTQHRSGACPLFPRAPLQTPSQPWLLSRQRQQDPTTHSHPQTPSAGQLPVLTLFQLKTTPPCPISIYTSRVPLHPFYKTPSSTERLQ